MDSRGCRFSRACLGGVMFRFRYKGGSKMGTRRDEEAADDAETVMRGPACRRGRAAV